VNQQSPPGAPSGAASSLDKTASSARSGFVFGLISAVVTLFASLNFLVPLFFYSRVQNLPILSSGEVVLLLIAMTPVAMIGLALSLAGWRSTTRQRQAVAGVALSVFALVPFFLAVIVIIISWTACRPSCI